MNTTPPPLRYVCLSDLHLGAANSLLTQVTASGRADPERPSACLVALARALRASVARMVEAAPSGALPRLILLGDVLDMGLADMANVQAGYRWFIEALFPASAPPVFSPQIVFVPGNHDHHLWRMCQDQHLVDTMQPLDVTPLLLDGTEPPLDSLLLTRLTRLASGDAQARVQVAYPNLGLFDAAAGRCVLMHHGHYADATYRVMTSFSDMVLGASAAATSIDRIERQNGPWVDFLWSDLGAAGSSGQAMQTLYEVLCDAGASRQFSLRLLNAVMGRLSGLGMDPDTVLMKGFTIGQLLAGVADASLGRGAQSQRYANVSLTTPAALDDLRWYLAGPLFEQARAAGLPAAALDTAFVYGHTHKPFQDELAVPGYGQPLAIYNTGGWVVDQPTLVDSQGASALFIDERLDVAALRLFNDAPNGRLEPVHVAGLGGFRDAANPLLAALAEAIEPDAALWADFSGHAQAAIEQRSTWLLDEFFAPGRSAEPSREAQTS
ncbi:hypothetical protein [Ideonella sp.]|uniref:hypothetical protein n=1 Tax=Ideonella sp. TaxID=1929293 RepID=UPI002B499E8B|nr:hypothetical protein [Ideonella sp.]HJV70262.1 hypothetical protein [Ideonella sp.]